MATKLSEEAVRKLLGTRTPLPGADQGPGANWTPRKGPKAPSGKTGIAGLPANPVTDPGAILQQQLEDAGADGNSPQQPAPGSQPGMKRGGKVKKMASGGSVRGCGMATKGKTKGRYI
jgi:hypothetical protein